MAVTVCRWGILGAANIARKNWKAIRLAENATLTAVASREPARAKEWLDTNQAECPFPTPPAACSYDDLLKRPDVDAVYVLTDGVPSRGAETDRTGILGELAYLNRFRLVQVNCIQAGSKEGLGKRWEGFLDDLAAANDGLAVRE